jgi:ribonuclease HI
LVGILLALDLAKSLPRNTEAIYIHLDNQAAIRARTINPERQAAQHIILNIHERCKSLTRTHSKAKLHLSWIPGHQGIPGNEAADSEAKTAANNPDIDPLLLPTEKHDSATVAKQEARAFFKPPPPEKPNNATHHRRSRGQLTPRQTVTLLSSLTRSVAS